MLLRTLMALVILLPVSNHVMADAYKCEYQPERIGYQEYPCPETAKQSIVRVFDNSSRIDNHSRADVNPWVAKLVEAEEKQRKSQRERAQKQKLFEERMRAAALTDKRDAENCEKYTALYEKRKKQAGVEVMDFATGEMRIDKSAAAQEMISSTKDTMRMYCG